MASTLRQEKPEALTDVECRSERLSRIAGRQCDCDGVENASSRFDVAGRILVPLVDTHIEI